MPATKVQQATSTGAAPALSGVVQGNFVYLFSHAFRSASVTAETAATDSNGTVTTQDRLAVASGPDGILAAAYYVPNANSGTHTFTCQNFGAGAQERAVFEFSGVEKSANPLDVKTSNSTTVAGATSVTTGTTGATGQADELILVGATLGGSPGVLNVGWTDPIAGFTALAKFSNDSTDIAGLTNFKNVAATGTQTATFNWTDNTASPQGAIALIGAFRNATGGATPLQTAKPLLVTLQRDSGQFRAAPIPSYLRDFIPPAIVPAIPGNAQHPILARFERRFGRTRMGHLPLAPVAGAAALVLTADPGSFVIAGTAANFLLAMPADSGVFTITGTDITPRLSMPAAAGAFTITGTVASLLATHRIVADPGSYVITGTAAAARVSMPADPGSYSITGTAAAFAVVMPAASGSVLITGTAATLTPSGTFPTLAADPGSVVIGGTAASLRADDRLVADPGQVLISGSAATLILTPLGQASTIDGSGLRFTGRRRAALKRTPEDIAREQKMIQDYLDELERKQALAQVPGAATPGTRAAEAGSQEVEPATSVKGTEVASPAPVLHAVARVNALQRMAELEEEALEAERNEQQQQRRRAAASAVLLMSY
jgi:hypothetical protein